MRGANRIAVSLIVLFLVGVVCWIVLPDVSKLKKENPVRTSFMKFRERQWREQGRTMKIRQIWVPLSGISPYVIKAVLIGEDDKFWRHRGFDFDAIGEAIEKDIKQKKLKFGGSTISQQLAKNLYLSPSRNPLRKIKEAILTWMIEKTLSKKRILELYLNVAEWGEGIFGIGAASYHYYGKHPSGLGPREAARLASVLPNPVKYRPVGTSRYVENRSRMIYDIMARRGLIEQGYGE